MSLRFGKLGVALLVLICTAILLASSAVFAKGEIESIKVSVNRDTIGLDEQVILKVEIVGKQQNIPRPKMPTLAVFEVYSQGRSSNISISNGQVEASITYSYVMVPQKAGTFLIKGIAVVYNNQRYEGNIVTITVLGTSVAAKPKIENTAIDESGKKRDFFMEAIVDNRNPYVNQQVTLTLKIYFGVQTFGSPELSEPSTTGFWTELLGNKAPYYQKLNNRNYRVIERSYALFPTQTGKLTIGRAIITATIAGRKNRRDPFAMFGMFGGGQEVRVRSKPIDIKVRPLPLEGRPKTFTGTIGRFDITTSVNKTRVEVNQPVSVTYRIDGVGNIKSVAEPVIPKLDEFRVYRASSTENMTKINGKIGGSKIFEEVFIPKKPGKLTIPSIRFDYFDPVKGKYKKVRTKSITLNVTKPEGYVDLPDYSISGGGVTIGSGSNDIRFISEKSEQFSPIGEIILSNPIYIVVNAVPVVLFAGLVAFRVRRERFASNVSIARSRAASRMARKRLARARELATVDKSSEFFAEVSQVLMSYISDKLNISPHGLTTDALEEILSERKVDKELINQLISFLRQADFARFTPSTIEEGNIQNSLEIATGLLTRIEREKLA